MGDARCFMCGAEATEIIGMVGGRGGGYLCDECPPSDGNASDTSATASTIASVTVSPPTARADGGAPVAEADTSVSIAATPALSIERGIPAPLAELGQVFIPVEPGKKGPDRLRTDDTLHTADDPILRAYVEDNGWNYAIACRGETAIIDADDPDALADLLETLPETAWQVSGSRSSEHHFLHVPGLDDDIPLTDPESGANVGHVKGAAQSVVIGPGSLHPSGNRYGPLQGDEIAEIDADDLRT